MGPGNGTHPSEGDNIKCVFSSVNCIQELWLRTVWVAIQLQLAYRIPRQVGKQDLGETKPSTQFPLGKRGEEKKKDRRPPVDEGGIAIRGNVTSTGQFLGT